MLVSECCRLNSKGVKNCSRSLPKKIFAKENTVKCFYVPKCVTVNRRVGGFCKSGIEDSAENWEMV